MFWERLNAFADSPVGKLIAQLLIVSVGGAFITTAYSAITKYNNDKIETARAKEQEYWRLRGDLYALFYAHFTAVTREVQYISRGEVSKAKEFSEEGLQKAADTWHSRQLDFYTPLAQGPLADLDFCKPTNPRIKCLKQTPPSELMACPRFLLFGCDPAEDENSYDGYYAPLSVHYAFLNASHHIRDILNSDWARCMRLAEGAATKQIGDCVGSENIDAMLDCSKQVGSFQSSARERCKMLPGAELRRLLGKDRDAVESLWEKFRVQLETTRKSMLVAEKP